MVPVSVFACTLGANAASWLFGAVFIQLILPGGITVQPVGPHGSWGAYYAHTPNYDYLILWAFLVALLLSIAIEWGVWRLVFRKRNLKSLGLMTTLANVMSYAVLITFFYYLY
jgi:hypothetical protein